MLIGTLTTKKQLVEDYGFDERQAEGVIAAVSSTEDQVVTKAELRRHTTRILLANAAINAALLALYGFAA